MEITIKDVFRLFQLGDRIMVISPEGQTVFKGFVDLFPEQFGMCTVNKVSLRTELNHRKRNGLGLAQPVDEKTIPRYTFSDLELRIYHVISLKRIVRMSNTPPAKNPNAYDWNLAKKEWDLDLTGIEDTVMDIAI